jgi:peptide/nickel transport system substrate-binding protein
MLSIPDSGTRLNALLGKQVDGMEGLDFTQAKAQMQSGSIAVLNAKGASVVPIYMATDLAPFQDARVRQAMRLLADRQALVNVAQLGFGDVSNDLFGKGLPFYNTQLPQRQQDPEQAKALLKAAGKADLKVALHASSAAPGMLESALAFAQQAKKGGVTIDILKEPADTYYGAKYLKQNFAQTNWFSESIIGHMSKSLARKPLETETHWNNAKWRSAYNAILKTVNETKRKQHYFDAQEILWNEGGYLIWGQYPLLDGLGKNVRGAVPNAAQPLARFDFERFWLA